MGSVVGSDLIDSGTEPADLSARGRRGHTAVTGAPGDSVSEHPCVPLLADKQASRITLVEGEGRSLHGEWGYHREVQRTGQGPSAHLAQGGPCTDHGAGDA